MQRHILGICALFLLAGAVYFRIRPPESDFTVTFYAACTRVGTLCAALWLAYRDLERLPRWIGSVILVAAITIAYRPRLAVIAIPLVIALTVLGWKKNKRS
ncbi:MAG: hypothetical protein GXX96_37790 [Planctomycetaceae bacterium]|jgi:hypothetical protein|nr:hypothetical protein [Planctomycetaceae bacterium]